MSHILPDASERPYTQSNAGAQDQDVPSCGARARLSDPFLLIRLTSYQMTS